MSTVGAGGMSVWLCVDVSWGLRADTNNHVTITGNTALKGRIDNVVTAGNSLSSSFSFHGAAVTTHAYNPIVQHSSSSVDRLYRPDDEYDCDCVPGRVVDEPNSGPTA
jgi:hypothetical protein